MKRIFSHSILSLFLLVMFCITGGGNSAKAQSYQLVTSTDGLVSGDKYLIVAKGYNKALGGINTSGNNRTAVAVTFDSDGSISTVPSDACVLELQAQDGGKWAFYDASNSGYLYAASSSSNYLRTQTALNDNGRATIEIDADGVATIKFTGTNTHNWLRYYKASGSVLFSCYESGQQNVYLYHYEAPVIGEADPKLYYSRTSDALLSGNVGEWTQPVLGSEVIGDISSLSIAYESSDESVATVSSAGKISLTGEAGGATVSAKFAGNETYQSQTATFTVNVFKAPDYDKAEGVYDNEVNVTITAAGAQGLVYTTDGTEPTLNNGTKVEATSKELTFNETTTLKAISYYGETLSGVASAVYTIQKVLAVPTITPEGGTFNYEKKVTIASPGVAAIVYTLDGTDPKDLGAGAEMIDGDSKEITITSSCTLKARTTDASGEQFSEGLATADFIINLPQPEITPSAESTQGQLITVTIKAEGASHIYYSTDGTDPTATSSSVVQVDAATTTFTLSEIGSYTIKAIALNSALDASDAATRTCTISKVVPVPGSATMKYKKVTSMDDIVDGGVYLLACPMQNVIMSDKGEGSYTAVARYEFSAEGETITGIENLNGTGGPCELALEMVEGKNNTYYIRYANGGKYLSNTSSTTLKFSDALPTDATTLLQYQWTLSLASRDVKGGEPVEAIKIQSNKDNQRSLDYSSSYSRYAAYIYSSASNASNAPSFLYKKTFDLSFNANTAGFATVYTNFPYAMPKGVDGYIITETAEEETIKAKKKYPAEAKVPAYAPLLIQNAEAGVTLNPVVLDNTETDYPYADENLLHGTRLESDGVTTDIDGTGTNTGYYYYKLTYTPGQENSYGFYRGKADGGAFEMRNTATAYLALPKSSGLVNGYRISIAAEEDPDTGIRVQANPSDNMQESAYTLAGVRVKAARSRLPKGIYIINGKKVAVK